MFTKTDDATVWKHTKQARLEIYNYISSLKAEEWDQASLCADWRVRDVVGHLILIYQYSAAEWGRGVLSSRFSVNTFIGDTAISKGSQATDVLLKEFREIVDANTLPAIVPSMNALADALIHEQDMRMALGHPRDMPLDSLRLIFDHWRSGRYNIGERITGIHKRTAGLQFVAQDINAQYGEGLEIVGRAQDILLVIAGRKPVLDSLRGNGMTVLERRLA